MHKLGDVLTPEEGKEKIKRILTARRKLYNAGVQLLECDRVYAGNIKSELERHTFASHTVPFVGAGAVKKQIDETDICLYLEAFMRIYVKEENIIIGTENSLCKIKLSDKLTANIPMRNGTAVKSILI